MGHQSNDLFPSPLRYPGGKRKVANFIKLLLLKNELVGGEYVEPYAGGASVALGLLLEGFVSQVHINDLDRRVHAFWSAVLTDTDELCARIHDTPVNMKQWHRQRKVLLGSDADPLDLAFATFFMNRCNRSGIILGGVIGGKEQTGGWKLDARYNKTDLIRRIKRIARQAPRISLTCLDASQLLTRWTAHCDQRTLIYLDPPYYVKGEGLYQNFYEHADHVEVAGLVRHLRVPWVVSYDAAPEIIELYSGWESWRYSLSYSAADRYSGPEAMFFAPSLVLPDVPSPAGIPAGAVERARQLAFG